MTLQKFHVNPDTGEVGPCSASIRECKYGDNVGANHYFLHEQAIAAGEAVLKEKHGAFPTKQKTRPATFEKEELSEKLSEASFEEIAAFIESSKSNYSKVEEVVEMRAAETPGRSASLYALSPYRKDGVKSPASPEVYKMMTDEHLQMRYETAQLVEALTDSPHFNPSYTSLKNNEKLGKAVKIGDLVPNSVEWLKSRRDSVGGSDVAALVTMDFVPEENRPFYAQKTYDRVVANKMMKNDDIPVPLHNKSIYIGNAWEAKIRDEFAKDNPQLKVYDTKSQYAHPERKWQTVNVDGVLSSREDGKPDGLLEIKTGNNPEDWKDDVPLNYRAQALYYLNTTGLEYIRVRALINDHETKDYVIHRNDEVYPGSKVNMETYITKRVQPWIESLKAERSSLTTV